MKQEEKLEQWRVSDDWSKLKPILDEYDPSKQIGRKRIDARAAIDAIIFRLRSGQWNPIEFLMIVLFIVPSNVGNRMRFGLHLGFSLRSVKNSVELIGTGKAQMRQWQRLDLGDETGPNPTDRAKPGTKRSVLTEAGWRSTGSSHQCAMFMIANCQP